MFLIAEVSVIRILKKKNFNHHELRGCTMKKDFRIIMQTLNVFFNI